MPTAKVFKIQSRTKANLMILACDLMTLNPRTILSSAPMGEAMDLLHALDVRHLPVVDEHGVLVGMLSDRDLRAVDGSSAGSLRPLDQPVQTFMSSAVATVDMEADALEIVDLMLDNKIGAVPVLDGDGGLVGIVSYVDLLREMSTLIE
jgi:acetoin utilization protein AcuB